MGSLSSSINANISGIRSVAEKTSANAQNLGSVGAIAAKKRLVFVTSNNVDPNPQTFTPAGVSTKNLILNTSVGAPIESSIPTHFCIQGQGYAVVSNAASEDTQRKINFTRVCTFAPDENGDFKNHEGQYLQVQYTDDKGIPLSGDVSTTAGLRTASVKSLNGAPSATTNVKTKITLPGTADLNTVKETPVTVIDALGISHAFTIQWTKTAEVQGTSQTWQGVVVCPDAAAVGAPYNAGIDVVFDGNGRIQTINGNAAAAPNLTLDWNNGSARSTITMDFGEIGGQDGIICVGNTYQTTRVETNGRAPGKYVGTTITADGYMVASFDNNEKRTFARIPIATFENANKLREESGGICVSTNESGKYQLNIAGERGSGVINSSKYEGSTIESSEIFTNIIMDQNENMGNLQAIKAVNEMLKAFFQVLN